MADPILDELNLVTLREIFPRSITENFFMGTPFASYLRDHAFAPFQGGVESQVTVRVKPMQGGFYDPGDTFSTVIRQTLTGMVFKPKTVEVSVPAQLEELSIYNRGPQAVFSLIDERLDNAFQTISTIIAIAMSRHGQNISGDDRSARINGWIEAINDGKTPGWDGNKFTSYGTQTRNAFVGNKLNSIPRWMGDSAGNPGPLTYDGLEQGYQDCSIGGKEPDIGVTTKRGFAGFKSRIAPQQRFQQERDPIVGVDSIRMNSARVMKDDYFPSAEYGENDADLGNWLTSTFAVPAGVDSKSGLPAQSVTCTVGEVFAWFNTLTWLFRVMNDPLFGLGFTGFQREFNGTKVAGFVLGAVNLECTSPRCNKQFYGING